MNIVQARLQIAIRTAYEEMFLGGKSPGLMMVIEKFKDPSTSPLKLQSLGMLVHHYNFAPKRKEENESTMFLAGVLFILDADLCAKTAALPEPLQQVVLEACLVAAVMSGEGVKDMDTHHVLLNYAIGSMVTGSSAWPSAFLVSDARKEMMASSVGRLSHTPGHTRNLTGFELPTGPTLH